MTDSYDLMTDVSLMAPPSCGPLTIVMIRLQYRPTAHTPYINHDTVYRESRNARANIIQLISVGVFNFSR